MNAILRSRPSLWAAWAALFAAAFVLAPMLGAASLSERFHWALPISFALCYAWRAGSDFPRSRRFVLPAILATLGVSTMFWMVIQQQASLAEGQATFGELLWRMAHLASILVLYGLWSRACVAAAGLPFRSRRSQLPTALAWMIRGVALASFAPFLVASFNAHRTKIGNATDPMRAEHLTFETVQFNSEDGVRLHAWWIPAAAPTSRCVVVCHGIGANAGSFVGAAPFLRRAGFNVLMLDFRGHGESAGHTTSFGFREALDVHAACKYLRDTRAQDRLALYGFSMGGAAVSLSFGQRFAYDTAFSRDVRAVVLDSTFAAFEPLARAQMPLPGWAEPGAMRVLGACSWLEIGVAPGGIAPEKSIARVAPRPLLIIHGDADRLIPLAQARRLFAAAREPRELRIVHGAGHCECRAVDVDAYEKHVARWLRAAMD